ncbi:MAG: putative sugar O-methyltransferase, partial [Deltaproteobacteria bacterium]|nr:putative sugar O-methyltransferase [Deltaproteobacteria bacterium]
GETPKMFVLLGDGYGTLGACIRNLFPQARLYFIDLPKGLLFQLKTMEKIGGENALLSEDKTEIAENNFVVPDAIGKIAEKIDCAINIASMQEMNQQSIATYFKFLRERSSPNSHFYCVNRLRKELPGGEVASFLDYPWNAKDQVFVDGSCPYYTHFYSPRTFKNGPRFLGLRIPFINHFDGPMVHRLVHLEKS